MTDSTSHDPQDSENKTPEKEKSSKKSQSEEKVYVPILYPVEETPFLAEKKNQGAPAGSETSESKSSDPSKKRELKKSIWVVESKVKKRTSKVSDLTSQTKSSQISSRKHRSPIVIDNTVKKSHPAHGAVLPSLAPELQKKIVDLIISQEKRETTSFSSYSKDQIEKLEGLKEETVQFLAEVLRNEMHRLKQCLKNVELDETLYQEMASIAVKNQIDLKVLINRVVNRFLLQYKQGNVPLPDPLQ